MTTKPNKLPRVAQCEGLLDRINLEIEVCSNAVDALETALKAAEAVAKSIPRKADDDLLGTFR